MACEMEGGAIGQICFVNQVPFTLLRAISDGADNSAVPITIFAKISVPICASHGVFDKQAVTLYGVVFFRNHL